MDSFCIRVDAPDEIALQGHLVVKVLINGTIVPEDRYCLDVESFFNAIGSHESRINLIGGCGVPECCGRSFATQSTREGFQIGDFKCRWKDIYKATDEILSALEQLPEEKYIYARLSSNLPIYHLIRAQVKNLASID
jgi:hypothetical protein